MQVDERVLGDLRVLPIGQVVGPLKVHIKLVALTRDLLNAGDSQSVIFDILLLHRVIDR
jgi:hypothetical protein